MLNKNIDLQKGSFSFSDYFKINIEVDELLNEFGYQFRKENILFNQTVKFIDNKLKDEINMLLSSIEFNTEMAIREFLIAPIFIILPLSFSASPKSEKSIYFNERLRGILDYYIESDNNFVVIEAKYQDLNNGFKQLAMELITLDKLIDNKNKQIFGAITIGTDWIFATIDRKNKIIIKDLKIYRVPEELDKLLGILNFIIDNK